MPLARPALATAQLQSTPAMRARAMLLLASAALASAVLRGGAGDDAGGRVLDALQGSAEVDPPLLTCGDDAQALGVVGEKAACTPGPHVDNCCEPEEYGFTLICSPVAKVCERAPSRAAIKDAFTDSIIASLEKVTTPGATPKQYEACDPTKRSCAAGQVCHYVVLMTHGPLLKHPKKPYACLTIAEAHHVDYIGRESAIVGGHTAH